MREQMSFQMRYWEDKEHRTFIRKEALAALRQQLASNTLRVADKSRLKNIAKAMPLYAKNHSSQYSFWPTPAQKMLDTFDTEHMFSPP